MAGFRGGPQVFVVTALLFQALLVAHFALRKWYFAVALDYGWIVYALSVPAAVLSVVLLARGEHWAFWTGGFVYLVWAAFGYAVEYILFVQWRSPIYWPVFGPYVLLYLATVMFYWWPLALISRQLWYTGAVLFIIGTILNVTSHGG